MKEIPAERFETLRAATLKISIATHNSQDLAELYKKIHEVIDELMPAKNFYIATVNSEQNTISFPYFVDEVDSPDGKTILPEMAIDGTTLTSMVIMKGDTVHFFKGMDESEPGYEELMLVGGDSEEWLGVPLKNSAGEVIGVIVVQRYDAETRNYDQLDVDVLNFVSNQIGLAIELKKREDTLKTSEDKYQALIENLNEMVYAVDRKGNILYVSPSVRRYGYDPESLIGKNVYFLMHQDDIAKFKSMVLEIIRGKIFTVTVRLYDRNRAIHWFQTSNTIRKEGDRLVLYGALTDITERIKIEKDLEISRQKLMEANKTKDNFFSILAHDLKSPFTGILGFSEFLVNDIDELTRDDIIDFAGRINSASKAILELLNNLLDWSRIQSDRLEFSPTKVNVDRLMFNINNVLVPTTYQKNLEYLTEIEENIDVYADKSMLETILRNLISNAVKFTPKDGSIIVSGEKEGEFFRFTVSDSGVGMSPETIEKLYDVNVLMTKLSTENEKGTGLGFILCNEFVKRHGGTLTVESIEGEGSTFSFTIPLYSPEKHGTD
ncbi:MAG: PAS domain S-box protein [Ignavibacteriales bacterium]|nr:MAG: PAS domain S-box protein [Ignavibacteriaceae bacterium]MBW7871840.1 PAS domain S-box protein [Ignavibacteria bacterium]MCZ2144310.1 PAS domain S-box protein [Ignavibacteriales bacterium]OQY75989.1 MAG: hypothetical protein B6D45_04820 [Ignavibacteriales bacterium UTCHB3]MBV6446263.1 Sensor histidine kinase RcsC [Ignavibacteriaceae bacterium]